MSLTATPALKVNTGYAAILREAIELAAAEGDGFTIKVLRTSLIMVERGQRPTRDAHRIVHDLGLLD